MDVTVKIKGILSSIESYRGKINMNILMRYNKIFAYFKMKYRFEYEFK